VPVRYFGDNKEVLSQARAIWRDGAIRRLGKSPNHDLWLKVLDVKLRHPQKTLTLVKIKSHEDAPEDVDSFEFYMWYGNDAADTLAIDGRNMHDHDRWEAMRAKWISKVHRMSVWASFVAECQLYMIRNKLLAFADKQQGDFPVGTGAKRFNEAHALLQVFTTHESFYKPKTNSGDCASVHDWQPLKVGVEIVNQASTKILAYGRVFLLRVLRYLYSLEWPVGDDLKIANVSHVSMVELTLDFIGATATMIPMPWKKSFELEDRVSGVRLVDRNLHQHTLVLFHAIEILVRIGAVYSLPSTIHTPILVPYGLRLNSFGYASRPRFVAPAEVDRMLLAYFSRHLRGDLKGPFPYRSNSSAVVDLQEVDVVVEAQSRVDDIF
jgi:hypothetical protein